MTRSADAGEKRKDRGMLSADCGMIRVCQLQVRQGDVEANAAAVIRAIGAARVSGKRLVIFPELALTGVMEAAEWRRDSLMSDSEAALRLVAAASAGMAVVLGTAVRYRGRAVSAAVAFEDGRPVVPEGSPVPFVPKKVAEVNRFDRHCGFLCAGAVAGMEGAPLETLTAPFVFNGLRVGVWLGRGEPEAARLLVRRGARLLVNLDTVPYVRNADEPDVGADMAAEFGVPVARCGAAGVVDTGKALFLLSGGSVLALPDRQVKGAPRFEEAFLDGDALSAAVVTGRHDASVVAIQAIEAACRAQMDRLGLERVVAGASGGIDSALTAAIYSRAVGSERLLLVNMPSRHNSKVTVGLARELAVNLGCYYTEIAIEESVRNTLAQIQGTVCRRQGAESDSFTLELNDAAVENVQARDRSGRVLAAVSSAFNGVFTCNANKSECTIGYGTMYGDIAGFFAALGDLWKTEVWELARAYNLKIFGKPMIPQGSIDIVPSAELSLEQNVEEGKGDPIIYAWHDRLFASWTEREPQAAPEDLLGWYAAGTLGQETGYGGDIMALFPDAARFCEDLEKMWRLYNGLARAKRLQAPPVLSLKNRTFGFDLGGAQLPVVFSPRYEAAKKTVIGRP